MSKEAAFWFHYNKPEAKRQGRPVMTVHYKGMCHMVRAVSCEVPVATRERKTQPHVVMAGRGTIEFSDGTAYIKRGGE
jgi:mannose-6-phosphate isomerase-like protein (cupin superfamily)